MFKGVLGQITKIYDKHYKQLLIIPIVILLLSVGVIVNHYVQTGEFVSKGVSLKGGTTISISTSVDTTELAATLHGKFPTADVSVRELSRAGSQAGIIIEASDVEPEELIAAIEETTGKLEKDQYTADTTGPTLGASFFKQALMSVAIAFILMSLVVYAYFRDPLPSFYAVFSVFADALFALAVFDLFQLKLTTAGIAAFLLLIGYSIDTDILLTTRVLKRTEGTVAERMTSTIPTGMTMNICALAVVIIAYYATHSEAMKQIMFILFWGLIADVIYTWLFNAALLRMHIEKKQQGASHGS